MAPKRFVLGCVIGFASVVAVTDVNAQVSPGPLSAPHRSLSGPTRCTSCHRVGAGSADFRCMECHKDITARILGGRGLHATFVGKNARASECVRCHSEHNGENFPLIKWEPVPGKFDHSRTGYVLEGTHAQLTCARCHNVALIPADEREKIVVLTRTYLGLSRACVSCHEDNHRGQLGKDCQRCHSPVSWKLEKQFDHRKTRYPLTGAHLTVACQKCHSPISGNQKNLNYLGLVFDRCTGCHQDPHKGAFQQSCQSCHTTAGWKRVNLAGNFDHSKTKYPLLGKHVSVECTKCHRGGDFKKPIPFNQCADCHKPDPHSGQFAKRADGGKCESCHTVEGFKPSRFGVPEHKETAYPLEGKHASVACAKCHIPAGKETQYKVRFAACTDCHKDAHANQFAAAPHNNRCERCHTVNSFRPSTFALAAHKLTRFQLVGAHVAVPCADCHKSEKTNGTSAVAGFRFSSLACTQCHTDPHKGQFADRMAQKNTSRSPAGCEACHSMKAWTDLSRFDHSTTDFPLTGSHRAVRCIGCHKPPNLEVTLRNVDFKKAPRQCQACHEEVHGNQFANAKGITECADCHTTTRWRPSTFDHDLRTSFPLKGGHQDVKCALCHTLVKDVSGRRVLFYKPTPKACADCHGANVPAVRK